MSDGRDAFPFQGYGIGGYRCFPDESVCVGPFGKVHLITGRNNSGKSVLADVAVRILPYVRYGAWSGMDYPLSNSDIPQSWYGHPLGRTTLSLCFGLDSLLSSEAAAKIKTQEHADTLRTILQHSKVMRGEEGLCWFDFVLERPQFMPDYSNCFTLSESQITKEDVDERQLQGLCREMCGTQGEFEAILWEVIRHVIPWDAIPQVVKVRARREATSESDDVDVWKVDGGTGLINKLLHLSNPKPEAQYENGRRWGQFVSLVRDVLDDDDAEVRIDADATMIQVKTDGADYLALVDLGTGIEELVILAAVAACNQDSLIVIEEPEVHLHPTLQAKLIKNFLDDQNGNRFIISTHSPTIINARGVSITQVERIGGRSRAREVRDVLALRDVLDDIGAHPSDLLQANYIVWVEGPSDRVYVNYWLSQVAPALREGLHFSVMIYGGRLLNSFDAEPDSQTSELISLFSINTHFCVIMDSDITEEEEGKISKTKARIVEECEKSRCMSWVTYGKTIENYVPRPMLEWALREVHSGKEYDNKLDDRYVGPLDAPFPGTETKPDKIKIARAITQQGYKLGTELRGKVEELAEDIRRVNGMLSAGGAQEVRSTGR